MRICIKVVINVLNIIIIIINKVFMIGDFELEIYKYVNKFFVIL